MRGVGGRGLSKSRYIAFALRKVESHHALAHVGHDRSMVGSNAPSLEQALHWIESQQSLTCTLVPVGQPIDLSTEAIEDTLGAGCCRG